MWTQAVLPQNKSRENTENTQQGVSQGARERGVGFGVRVGGERERKREREREREGGGGGEPLGATHPVAIGLEQEDRPCYRCVKRV